MQISIGRAGWLAVDDLGLPGPLYLRVADRDGRLRVTEVYLDGSAGDSIAGQDLQQVPLAQIEAFANQFADEVDDGGWGIDLSTLATYFSTGLGSEGPVAREIQIGNWVYASIVGQSLAPRERAELDPGEGQAPVVVARVKPQRRKAKNIRKLDAEFRLTSGPPPAGLTDDFLSDVSRAYIAAVSRGERPNVALAKQLGPGASRRTVERWVALCRDRGFLPRGRKGAAG